MHNGTLSSRNFYEQDKVCDLTRSVLGDVGKVILIAQEKEKKYIQKHKSKPFFHGLVTFGYLTLDDILFKDKEEKHTIPSFTHKEITTA